MLINPFQQDSSEAMLGSMLSQFEKIQEKSFHGETITVGDTTIITLYITTLGIGVAGSTMLGDGACGGGGGGTIPVAVVIISPQDTRVEFLSPDTAKTAVASLASLAMAMSERGRGKKMASTPFGEPDTRATETVGGL
jgi:uncharacterized spore protein YtfJ